MDLLADVEKKSEESRKRKIEDRLEHRGSGKQIFKWTKPILLFLRDKGKATTREIVKYLLEKYPGHYGELPEEEMENSVNTILRGLEKRETLKNIKELKFDTVFDYDQKVDRVGEIWCLTPVKYDMKKERKKFLQFAQEIKEKGKN